ncbi:MAG: efflux transporter periplasmic adaptor subunit [Clostridia bacterium]|nr:efflux transporter periplasmic adaptor subunit [Clostridia bacterium]
MKKVKRKIIGALFIGAVIVTAGVTVKNGAKAISVEAARVQKGDIAEYVEELGLVVSENKGSIYVEAAGKVTEVMAEVGDVVDKGDILVKLDSQQLSRQMMELEARKAALTAEYKEAIKPLDHKEIKKLELQLESQKREVEESKRQMDINKVLYDAEAISYEEYHTSEIDLKESEALLEGIKLDLELIKKPISSNIAAGYMAQLKQLDIQMEELRSQGEDFVVISPLKGTIMMKSVEVGSYLQPGSQVMEIGDSEALYIESDLLVSEIGKIKVGSKVEISHKDLGIEGVQGTIRKIYPRAFSKVSDLGVEQKRIKVEIAIEDQIKGLRPGYDLDLKIIVNSKKGTYIVPENAVFEKGGKNYVFANENNTAVLREIQKGIESSKQIEIVSGLQEGEQVILSPDEALEEGTAIIINTLKEF